MEKMGRDIRKLIIENARELFNTYGYSKVSMDELVAKVGISKKTLYQYFSSKEEILHEVIRQFSGNLSQTVESILLDDEMAFLEKIKRIFTTVGSEMASINTVMLEDIRRNVPSAWQRIMQIRDEAAYSRFRMLIEEGIRKGQVREDCPKTMAILLYASAIETFINPDFRKGLPAEIRSELPNSSMGMFEKLVEIIFEGILAR